ncbi:MAG: hypothetical protein HRT71_01615 [Flavobacteriales bacterium]|nr:hypothetical protein [Flavobacteriales bacterium]
MEKIKNHQASFKLNTDSLKEFKKQIRRSIKKQITANFIAINKSEIAINKNLFLSKKLNIQRINRRNYFNWENKNILDSIWITTNNLADKRDSILRIHDPLYAQYFVNTKENSTEYKRIRKWHKNKVKSARYIYKKIRNTESQSHSEKWKGLYDK